MSSTKLDAIAVAAKDAVEAAAITSLGNALKVYDYEPRDLDTLPALTIDGPVAFERVQPDEAESQLGSDDWNLTYTVRLYTALDDPETETRAMRAVLGQVIAAFDADRSLGGEAEIDSVLADGTREVIEDENQRAMAVYACSLRVWALVA